MTGWTDAEVFMYVIVCGFCFYYIVKESKS
jgi:hypothetical protein